MTQQQQVFGINISSKPLKQLLKDLQTILDKSVYSAYFVATVNPEFLVRAVEEDAFRKVLQQTDLNIADGNGLKLAGEFEEIIPGRILVEKLLQSDYKIFFLGGRNGVAREMAEKYGGQWDEGLADVLNERENVQLNDPIIKKINSFAPDILFVAYGAPQQEYWIGQYKKQLKVKLVMGVGGTFDVLTGRLKAPPHLVSQMGFEWLWRLVQEPFRWRRQLKLLKYLFLVIQK